MYGIGIHKGFECIFHSTKGFRKFPEIHMETLIIVLIVASAGLYLIRRFYKGLKKNGDCTCDCAACHVERTCKESSEEEPPES
jgi:hypothetical protein